MSYLHPDDPRTPAHVRPGEADKRLAAAQRDGIGLAVDGDRLVADALPVGPERDVVEAAAAVFTKIHAMRAEGTIPAVSSFAELHDHFDANTGWGDDIDALPPETWAAVTTQVDRMFAAYAPRKRR